MASSRTAGEAVAAARFPGRRRPLRQHGPVPGPLRRQARTARRSAGAQLVRHDQGRARARRPRSRSSWPSAQGTLPKTTDLLARTARPTRRPGRTRSRRPRNTTIRAASRPSSATNGRRTPAATTCTATSIFRDNGDKAAQVVPYTTDEAAGQRQSARPVEVDARLRGQDRRQCAGHCPQRQSVATACMFPVIESFTGKPVDKDYVEQRAQVGTALRGDPDQGRRRNPPAAVAQ